MIDESFVSERLAKLRTKKGVSARDMSINLGQSKNYINMIENKRAMPSMQVFFYICEYFKISPREFFDAETENPVIINDLLAELQKMDSEALNSILSIARSITKKK